MHFVYNIFHNFNRAGASCHNACSHVRKIGLLKVFMPQHGNEHGGNAVKCRNFFLVYAGKRAPRREHGHRRHGGAVGHRSRHSQHHAEAMEHGHLNHHSVCSGQIHAVANCLAVVHHVVVGEHNTLGEPGCAGGILHVANIMFVNLCAPAVNFFNWCFLRHCNGFIPGITARLLAVNRNDVFQARQFFRF